MTCPWLALHTLRGGGKVMGGRYLAGGAVGIAILTPCCSMDCFLCGPCRGGPHNVHAVHGDGRLVRVV